MLRMAVAWCPYQLVLACVAMRAMRRRLTGRTDVEKTRHVGAHRAQGEEADSHEREGRPHLVVAHGGKAPPAPAGRQVAEASGDGRENWILTTPKNAKKVWRAGQGDIQPQIYRVG
ncbi:hypothetical protein [Streptomyces dysideae]|uniref:Uncharacterized protein n=1 Tax=Streptomyces dysideae TaxID=909626 RepID=A0A124IDB0_9ACTN|nr:hypothetical protein [Streptomyces dysideae]KUO14526.1 hypothetical protein AQJ91_46350 [Streptomyces dysideae]